MKSLLCITAAFIFINATAQVATYQMVRTKGAIAYLEYGLGDDRLGGAKMGYLDSNVVLKVVDSIHSDYKVQLSKNHFAYLPKSSVIAAVDIVPKPYYLSSSIKVYGDDKHDYVVINLDEKLPYKSQQVIQPAGLWIDIYGATSNTNWITQLSTVKEITQTWTEQIEDDVLRVHIRLKNNEHWGHAIYYDSISRKMYVRVKREPVKDIRKWKIAIDAGHGGTNVGAAGVTSKRYEKEYALLIAKEFQSALRLAGVKNVVMVRDKDTTLSMEERTVMLRKEDPDLLISIHLNSSSIDTIKGTSTFYRHIGFRNVSKHILQQMLTLGLKEYGNVGNFNFALSGPTEFQNCLVEVAFLSNKEDEKKIMNAAFRKSVANKILEGIRSYAKTL
ncbi:MAG: N-acetylmuramoyl-L-alanine amidase [Sphingobacteriales bacterium]|jgi:N-acetylmuramoyl-L-alanine amidase